MTHEKGRPGESALCSTQPTTATTRVEDGGDINAALVKSLGQVVSDLIADLNAAREHIAEAYRNGYADGEADGVQRGVEQTEREMAEEWARVADQVRRSASPRSRTYAERRQAELEAAKPKSGDYTGHLSAAEYLGATAQGQPPERRTE